MIDRKQFFDAVRKNPFKGKLALRQTEGIEAILAEWDKRKLSDLRWLAYMLATTKWETAHTMQPVREIGGPAYFKKMYDVTGSRPAAAKRNGNINPGDGARYCGRGYVQLTWRNNYRAMGKLLAVDLEGDPDLALKPDIAAAIMFEGMTRGTFTGKSLSHYFNRSADNAVEARRIINGTDHGKEIAELHRSFFAALQSAYSAIPPPDIEPVAEKPKVSWFNALLSAFFRRS